MLVISHLLYRLPNYNELPKSPIIYPLFVVVNSLTSLLILCFVSVGILFFYWIWTSEYRKPKRFAILGIFMLFPVLSCLGLYSVFFDFADVTHMQSLEFNGRIYHLGRVTEDWWDDPYISVVVYECDITGMLCCPIYDREGYITGVQSWDDTYLNASLVVDSANNQLMLQLGDEQIPEIPVVFESK